MGIIMYLYISTNIHHFHYMAVQDASGRIGDRLVEIISVNQNRIQACNGTPGHRRLSAGEPDFPLLHGKTGQGIHHQKHILASVPEIFRNSRGIICSYFLTSTLLSILLLRISNPDH